MSILARLDPAQKSGGTTPHGAAARHLKTHFRGELRDMVVRPHRVDAGGHPAAELPAQQILGRTIAARRWGKRAAADPADAGVQLGRPALQ